MGQAKSEIPEPVVCPNCEGAGLRYGMECPVCEGEGTLTLCTCPTCGHEHLDPDVEARLQHERAIDEQDIKG